MVAAIDVENDFQKDLKEGGVVLGYRSSPASGRKQKVASARKDS